MGRGKNEVTLTFAGDTDKLESSFSKVGASSREMTAEVGKASEGFDKVGESADRGEMRILGAKDAVDGVATVMKGPGEQGIAAYIQGWADLSSGVANFIIPTTKALLLTGRQRVVSLAAAAATRAQTVATWALNVAMRANPIGLVITALVALGAIFVVVWSRSQRFRAIVSGAFQAVWGWIKRNWPLLLGILTGPIGLAVIAIVKNRDKIINAFKAVPEAIRRAFSTMVDAIRNAWNNTLGGKGFTAPSWLPGIGGKEFRIPRLHRGGIVPGPPGAEVLTLLQGGERVIERGGGGGALVIRSGGTALDDALVSLLAHAVRGRGGNAQAVLGGR